MHMFFMCSYSSYDVFKCTTQEPRNCNALKAYPTSITISTVIPRMETLSLRAPPLFKDLSPKSNISILTSTSPFPSWACSWPLPLAQRVCPNRRALLSDQVALWLEELDAVLTTCLHAAKQGSRFTYVPTVRTRSRLLVYMSMFMLLGHWLCICGAVTLRGSDRSKAPSLLSLPIAHQSDVDVPSGQNATSLDESGYVYNSSEISILIPETRPLVTLPVVALQAHTHFPELRIQIMYGSTNKQYVQTQKTLVELQQKGVVFLTPMPGDAYDVDRLPDYDHRHQAYSKALTSPEFWKLITTPKVLLAQADTWMCNGAHKHLKDFLQDDYVGAPWTSSRRRCPKKWVGNGGFSLRDREAMLRITQSVRPEPDYLNEDLFFCSNLQDSEKLPSAEVANHFAREGFSEQERSSGPNMPSVGVHNLWLTPDDMRTFFEGQCPGVTLACHGLDPAHPEKGVVDVDPKKEALGSLEFLGEDLVQKWKQEFFPQTVALLQVSNSGIMDSVSLTLMAKIFSSEALHDPSAVDFLRETSKALQ